MLVVHAIQAGQAGYYLGGPGPGRWVGSGSGALGLADVVEESALRAVLAGHHPGSDERLLSRIPARRRAGFDLVLAAPKSVSMLTALASDRDGTRLAGAHERAVEDTIGFIERWATWTRRGAEHRRIPTTGLVAAAFTHNWSWAGDPHRHTHVVVANLLEGADGKWSCLDSRSVYRHARAAGAIYQASLRHHLAAGGFAFAWQVRPDGLADVVGVPRPAIASCSQRSRQILDDVQREGVAGPRARQVAAGRTRRQQHAGVGGSWRPRAAEAGFDQDA
ncbi:MAG TPA: MobF family relaxase, partial [Acidimicrobiales bacterium]|nr:MobF family relaxase [Acidimicrobiales bacterium]